MSSVAFHGPFDPVVRAPHSSSPVLGSNVEVVLDLSRLLSRLLHSTPTGVDRVEMAYARGLMRTI
ncbi:MAG: glycosyl transferase group 1, partial [Sphingomonas bacterium]|nr:glycosyl transferase group 1 [Sphingomonas bacterium]